MKGTFPIEKFKELQTPFYYYDADLLRETLKVLTAEAGKHENFVVHYAVKANANPKVLNIIHNAGLGADCVSGGEINAALKAGFPASGIVYAGVGKSDWESELGLQKGLDIDGLTEDGKFSLQAVRCVGCCGLAPVMTIGGEVFGKVTKNQIAGILDKFE